MFGLVIWHSRFVFESQISAVRVLRKCHHVCPWNVRLWCWMYPCRDFIEIRKWNGRELKIPSRNQYRSILFQPLFFFACSSESSVVDWDAFSKAFFLQSELAKNAKNLCYLIRSSFYLKLNAWNQTPFREETGQLNLYVLNWTAKERSGFLCKHPWISPCRSRCSTDTASHIFCVFKSFCLLCCSKL